MIVGIDNEKARFGVLLYLLVGVWSTSLAFFNLYEVLLNMAQASLFSLIRWHFFPLHVYITNAYLESYSSMLKHFPS